MGDPKENLGQEVKAALEISARLRTAALLLTIIAVLAALVLFAYRPAVNNSDLFDTTYTPSFARVLVKNHHKELAAIFSSNMHAFDSPYDGIASTYVRAADDATKGTALLTFLNNKSQAQKQYLLLVTESKALARAFNEYLEDSKSRWQEFTLPVLDVKITRNEAIFYLCVAFAAVHFYFTIKHRYLIRIRGRFEHLSFLPDPSLLSATPDDLEVLAKPLRVLIYALQEFYLLALPLVISVAVSLFFFRVAGADFSDYTRTFVGATVSIAEFVLALILAFSDRKRKKQMVRSLFSKV